MKKEIIRGTNGKEIVRLIPETEEDIKRLREMAKAEELDDRAGFRD